MKMTSVKVNVKNKKNSIINLPALFIVEQLPGGILNKSPGIKQTVWCLVPHRFSIQLEPFMTIN